MERFVEGSSVVVVDESRAPIYFAAWFGAPTESIAKKYLDWSAKVVERAIATKRPCVIIVDSEHAERPSSRVRAFIADKSEHTPRAEKLVAVFVSLPSPLIRGALTAMQWLTRRPWPMTTVASVEEGCSKGMAFLESAGGVPPVGFDPDKPPRLTR